MIGNIYITSILYHSNVINHNYLGIYSKIESESIKNLNTNF